MERVDVSAATLAVPAAVHPRIAALSERIRDAHAHHTPLRIVGSGTWLGAGRPVAPGAEPLHAGTLRGILEYVPGDLTLTALAGTPLGEIAEATRANGQRLALDPYGSDEGSIGATIATASAGPLAGTHGTPRDLVLGLVFVDGTGEIVRAGGRVVKNVAGFDLVRLATGAWGTLGVLAEITVRLRALPVVDDTVVIPVDAGDPAAVGAVAAAFRAIPFPFDAAEVLDASTTTALGLAPAGTGSLAVRFGGTVETANAARIALASLGTVHDADPVVWQRIRVLESHDDATIRVSHLPARAADAWLAASAMARAGGGRAHLSLTRTVARVAVPRDGAPGALAAAAGFDGVWIPERLPADAWHGMPRRDDAVHARLSAGVRRAFDPGGILNPGLVAPAEGGA